MREGLRLTLGALRSRFNKAHTLAKVDFQIRDIRAKAADLAHSQTLLLLFLCCSTHNETKRRHNNIAQPLASF